MRRPWVSAGCRARRCCWRSRCRRSRSTSATARCASSRRATRRAWARSSPRRQHGPGAAGPTQVLVELRRRARLPTPANRAALLDYAARAARATPRWRTVARAAALAATAARRCRGAAAPRPREPAGRGAREPPAGGRSAPLDGVAEVEVGGATAFNEDFKDLVSGSMWKILLFVLAFSYLVLLVLLRSVLLPLKAVLVNLLSVARRVRRAGRGVPVGLVRRLPRLPLARLHEHDDAAVPAGDRVRPVDGLRGVPALADPRALRRDRRHPRRRARGPAGQREHDLERRADHGRGVRRVRRSPACRRSRRSGWAWRWRSRSTRRSCGWSSCRRRWRSWAAGTGGCRRARPRAAARRLRGRAGATERAAASA